MRNHKSISIIIPVYNEQENIIHVYTQVREVLQSLKTLYSYEFIFVNDGSEDGSWPILVSLSRADTCVKAINFSRNFGHQAALSAGYMHAKGDGVITMDADLQDPPRLLAQMINAWQADAAIVYARRTNRKDSLPKRITAFLYYQLLNVVSEVPMPRNVGDFRLLDRTVVEQLNAMPERARNLRGMVAWTGFKHAFVDFERPNRVAGVSGYTWKKMFTLGFDGITSFSLMPLRIALYVGSFLIGFGCCALSYAVVQTIWGNSIAAMSWLSIGASLLMGMQFLCIWMLGEYVGRMYTQQRERPLYIINEIVAQENDVEIAIPSIAKSQDLGHKEMQ